MIHLSGIIRQILLRIFPSVILLGFLTFAPNLDSQAMDSRQEESLPSLSLIGVIVSNDASSSIAVLKVQQTGKTKILQIGESINGYILSQVFDNRIILKRGEQTFQIFLGRGSLVRTMQPSPEKSAVPSIPEINEEPVESQLPTNNLIKMEFDRAELESKLQAELPLIMQEARFVPNVVNGKVSGFRITNLPSESVISEVGIRKNDIIKKINNVELNNVENLFGLYERFKDDNRFEVSIERSGTLIRILYILK